MQEAAALGATGLQEAAALAATGLQEAAVLGTCGSQEAATQCMRAPPTVPVACRTVPPCPTGLSRRTFRAPCLSQGQRRAGRLGACRGRTVARLHRVPVRRQAPSLLVYLGATQRHGAHQATVTVLLLVVPPQPHSRMQQSRRVWRPAGPTPLLGMAVGVPRRLVAARRGVRMWSKWPAGYGSGLRCTARETAPNGGRGWLRRVTARWALCGCWSCLLHGSRGMGRKEGRAQVEQRGGS